MKLLRLGEGIRAVIGEPALLLSRRGEKALVVADLHIGWESSLADKGFHIPSQVGRMLEALEELLNALDPDLLIFLGDLKHTVAGAEAEEWAEIPAFLRRLSSLVNDIRLIPGNHDGRIELLLPEGVELLDSGGLALWGTFGLFHGHAWPDPGLLECRYLISGHMHPVVVLREGPYFRTSSRVWLKIPLDGPGLAEEVLRRKGGRDLEPGRARARELVVMPSFNEFLGGQAVNFPRRTDKNLIGPIMRSRNAPLQEAEVLMLDGTFLGTVGMLREIGI